ncbi:DegT/DnrJ/EryC1/StrS family protein [Parvularcula bermudensis HTCC2503]|uniref:DegT/DnrJ/EryC1/StrS family protein n=1 Tax=Parvularcula bermudensis (strain ATCC BAA-594 / HTCC2503 / KCTC 12087) TaxID=314260 RepID=E0TBH3_PARBH|nr:DegT/DnrJ/EryC1/StrS family aminotransferase [Parvularcula bermudensis]ADM08348.1 DegT/DnrJ/EryC1/StrS family protein [Parvularcula bermudensis HTCC2503]
MNGVANLALERETRVGTIAFIDLKAQQKLIRERIEKRLLDVLDHGRYIAGPEIDELEKTLADKVGVQHCIACSSGTDALLIPMMGLKLQPTDAVFIPAFTYNATANAVLVAGGRPVFVDIDPSTLNMCPNDLDRRIDEAKQAGLTPRVVCPVDLFGAPADYMTIGTIAASHGLTLFADGAQSFGGKHQGSWVGAIASVTGCSFFPGKSLGAYGDGGATFTDDDEMAELCRSIRWHGTDNDRAISVRVGINGRMASLQAAVLLEKEAIFWDELKRRHEIAAIYASDLDGFATPQEIPPGIESGYGYYTIRTVQRDAIREAMTKIGVPTAIYYKTPLHKMPAFAHLAPEGGLPGCEAAAGQVLSLPMHPYLTDDQAHFVCDAFKAAKKEVCGG